MTFLWVCLIIGVIAIGIYIYSSYEKKVQLVKDKFRENNKRFYNLAEGFFKVKTNGLKVSQWDKDHTIDFIINNNAHQLIEELKNYNDLKVWWQESMPKIKKHNSIW